MMKVRILNCFKKCMKKTKGTPDDCLSHRKKSTKKCKTQSTEFFIDENKGKIFKKHCTTGVFQTYKVCRNVLAPEQKFLSISFLSLLSLI